MAYEDIEVPLPSYTPPPPPPCYSCCLACGERLIQQTPRAGSRPTGTYKKESGGVTVVLTEQDEDASIPTYNRHTPVNGAVAFDHRESITEVKVKFMGQMRLIIPGSMSRNVTLVEESRTLWSSESPAASSSLCPGTIPFSFNFPSTFESKDHSHPLPPSFDLSCLGPSGLTASIKYTLQIKVVKVGFWLKAKKITIPLSYKPRSRPPRPVLSEHDLFSDLKVSPEEWHQTMSTVPSRVPETVQPVTAHLFIPSTKVFSYGETIPFHVQLTGAIRSLRDLSSDGHEPPHVKVHILRQVSLSVDGEKAWRNNTIAVGKVWAIPPPMNSITNSLTSREDSLDWEGTLKVPETLSSPSFNVGYISVKDFVVLTVTPVVPGKSSLQTHQSSISIKLVTDPWTEGPMGP